MKNKIIQTVAEGLLGELPRHKGPFVSSAEARRIAHHDNKKRFEVSERIATRIMEQLGECYVPCDEEEADLYVSEYMVGAETFFLKKLPPHPKEEEKRINLLKSINEAEKRDLLNTLTEYFKGCRDGVKAATTHPKEEQYDDCENCGQAVYVDGLYDGEWVICRECGLAGGVIIDEETSYISIQWIDSKEETDWDKLREQFFEECVDVYAHPSAISGLKYVSMAPHDLFEWFKKKLSSPLKEEPKDSGWISVGDALPPLAPRSECAGEMPYSITVKVRDWGVLEYEAMYDYEHREWLQMPYENIIAERIVKWQSLPDPPTVETKKD